MLSQETTNEILNCDLQELEYLAYDVKDLICQREDAVEAIQMLSSIGLNASADFCGHKRPK